MLHRHLLSPLNRTHLHCQWSAVDSGRPRTNRCFEKRDIQNRTMLRQLFDSGPGMMTAIHGMKTPITQAGIILKFDDNEMTLQIGTSSLAKRKVNSRTSRNKIHSLLRFPIPRIQQLILRSPTGSYWKRSTPLSSISCGPSFPAFPSDRSKIRS